LRDITALIVSSSGCILPDLIILVLKINLNNIHRDEWKINILKVIEYFIIYG